MQEHSIIILIEHILIELPIMTIIYWNGQIDLSIMLFILLKFECV